MDIRNALQCPILALYIALIRVVIASFGFGTLSSGMAKVFRNYYHIGNQITETFASGYITTQQQEEQPSNLLNMNVLQNNGGGRVWH